MKRKILSGVAALLLVACSGEDSGAVNDTTTKNLPAEKELNTVSYYNDGDSEPYDIQEFENNKMISWSHYSAGILQFSHEFTYNEDGNLSVMTGKDAQGVQFLERTVSYDENGRIISKNESTYNSIQDSTVNENTTYTYNADNSVTVSIGNSKEGNEVRIYYFDNAGKLNKVTKNGYIEQELVYEGNSIVHIGTTDFTYDELTTVKGKFLNIFSGQFTTYSNFVLYNGYLFPQALSDKYLIKMDSNPGIWGDVDYAYEFDEQGYPIEVICDSEISNDVRTLITYK